MGDVAHAAADHLIARADHVPTGVHLDLPRPGQTGQQPARVHLHRGEGRDFLREGHGGGVLAHRLQPHRPGGDRTGVAVLQP